MNQKENKSKITTAKLFSGNEESVEEEGERKKTKKTKKEEGKDNNHYLDN